MRPIAIFYHGLFWAGDPPTLRPNAIQVVRTQMERLKYTGLLDEATEVVVGINGAAESESIASMLVPTKARIVMHGLQSRSENLTLIELEKWAPEHPGWNVLYFHAKGATHDPTTDYGKLANRWRECMMRRCVDQWRIATAELEAGWEAVGCHWLTGMGSDHSQHYFAGNFYWVRSEFFATIPSMFTRDRIKTSGIGALESRYEAEVVLGNGPRLPRIKDLEPGHGLGQCP